MLPKAFATEELAAINAQVQNSGPDFLLSAPRLTDSDILAFGKYIQCYNFIELNLRRSVEALALSKVLPSPFLERHKKLRASELAPALAACAPHLGLSDPERQRLIAMLDHIEHCRSQRNLFAHWAVRRHTDQRFLVFFTKSESDAKQLLGSGLEPGRVMNAVMYVEDLHKSVEFIGNLDYEFAHVTAHWTKRIESRFHE